MSVLIGVGLGLLSGFVGGAVDGFIMRVCDVMLSFPAILVALLIDGVGRAMFPNAHESLAVYVLVIAIALLGGCDTRVRFVVRLWWNATGSMCRPHA